MEYEITQTKPVEQCVLRIIKWMYFFKCPFSPQRILKLKVEKMQEKENNSLFFALVSVVSFAK